MTRSDLSAARACLGFALRKAARAVTRRYDAALRTAGMRSTQFNLLVVLEVTGRISIGALSRVTAIERTTLTRNVALLVKKGWVRAALGKDRRSRELAITQRGRSAALRALPAWRRAHTSLRAVIGHDRFRDLCERLAGLTSV
jgi:DNA-binding MarR family transcriptional regulator